MQHNRFDELYAFKLLVVYSGTISGSSTSILVFFLSTDHVVVTFNTEH